MTKVNTAQRDTFAVTIGTQLGSLQILALLGRGGMGEVYRACDTKLKREVSIKILPDGFSRNPGRAALFQREAEVLASLNHPNIATQSAITVVLNWAAGLKK